MTGRKKSAIYAGIQAGEFPRPIRIGAKAVGWRSDEIDRWIAACTVERDGANNPPPRAA